MHDTTKATGLSAPKKSLQKHDENGGEILDPTPLEPPLGYRKTPSLSEQIQQQVRIAQLKILEDSLDPETEDEADDFEIGDDYEPLSKHENENMPTLANLKKRAAEIQAAIKKRNTELAIEGYKNSIKKTQAVTSPPAQPENNDLVSE